MDKLWPIHTLVFDLDDTLYAERDYVFSGFRAVGAWVEAIYGDKRFAAEAQDLFNAGVRGKIFDHALGKLGIRSSAELIANMLGVYRQHSPDLSLYPGAEDILDWGKRHFALVLISDGYIEVQQRKVQSLQLDRWFNALLLTDRWGREYWKPHAQAFLETATRFPGPPIGFAYVGDNPKKDFIGAREQGWRTIRVRSPGGEHSFEAPPLPLAADIEIESLADLKSWIAPWDRSMSPLPDLASIRSERPQT
jgi:putative hydrolase of the HAD superfamily